jgi:hypothetical protein
MISERFIVRFAKGLSQKRAIKAAATSQTIRTQKIVTHDPVFRQRMKVRWVTWRERLTNAAMAARVADH